MLYIMATETALNLTAEMRNNLGGDSVRIETKSGEFVCTATRYADGSISVCTIDN